MSFQLTTTCVSANGSDIGSMIEQAEEITPEEFMEHCEYDKAQHMLGYTDASGLEVCEGLSLASDYTTSFYKSQYRGKECYYFEWSCIEHVYTGG